jgi:hypothetical protein
MINARPLRALERSVGWLAGVPGAQSVAANPIALLMDKQDRRWALCAQARHWIPKPSWHKAVLLFVREYDVASAARTGDSLNSISRWPGHRRRRTTRPC